MSKYLPIATQLFRFEHRPGRGLHQCLKVRAGEHEVEITVSPAGNRWHVWIDGEKVR